MKKPIEMKKKLMAICDRSAKLPTDIKNIKIQCAEKNKFLQIGVQLSMSQANIPHASILLYPGCEIRTSADAKQLKWQKVK